jgi:predicted PurR-regulated permease PerM
VRIDWRRVLVVELALLAGCALLVVVGWIVSRFAHTVLVLLMAIVVAFALAPVVSAVEARLGGRRGLAAGLVYLGLLVVVVGGGALLARPFVQQLTELVGDLPRYADMAKSQLPGLQTQAQTLGLPIDLAGLQSRAVAFASEQMGTVLGGTLTVVTSLTGLVVDVALILVVSFYLVLDSRRIRETLFSLVPENRRHHALFVEETTVRIAGGYLRGQLALGAIIGLMGTLGALLFGLPYPLIIGVVAGVTELIPMVGPIIGAILPIMLALFQPFPTVIWVIIFFFVVQQFETNILGPRITGHAVGLHPLGAMFALLAGFQTAGVLGGLFAVPLAGIVWVLVAAAYRNVMTEPLPSRRGLVNRFRRRTDLVPPAPRQASRHAATPTRPSAPRATDEPAE